MSLSALRAAHRNDVYLPGPGDIATPEPGPWCECADCMGTGKDDRGNDCPICDGLGSYYDAGAEALDD